MSEEVSRIIILISNQSQWSAKLGVGLEFLSLLARMINEILIPRRLIDQVLFQSAVCWLLTRCLMMV